jgi:plasmid stability protein
VQALLATLALLASQCYAVFVATIVIRKLDETVKRKLQVRAALNGRSMEAEARATLNDLLEESPTEGAAHAVKVRRDSAGLGTAIHTRFAARGGVDLKIPPRTFSKYSDASELPQLDKGLGTAIHELFAPLGGVELPILPRRKSHRKIPTFS